VKCEFPHEFRTGLVQTRHSSFTTIWRNVRVGKVSIIAQTSSILIC
jgi:hypothetical protein